MLGEFRKAAEIFSGNVEALRVETPDPRRSRFVSESRAWLTRVLGLLGEFVEGRRQGEEAIRLATPQGTAPIVAHGGLGQLHLAQGDFAAAIPVLEAGLALCRAADEKAWGVTIAGALGEAYACAGHLAEGVALLEQAWSDAFQRGALGTQVVLSQRLGTVYLLAMRLDEARHHTRLALDAARQQKSRGLEAAALLTLGEVHAHTGSAEIPQAETAYRNALALAESCGMRPLVAHCHLGLGKLHRRTGEREQAHEHLTTAATMYREMDMRFWLEQAETKMTEPA
jgi:tetratricopeptide (TPR) repeat protein